MPTSERIVKNRNMKCLYFPSRITSTMEKILNYPLAIVEAPMGYGKTTSVREYLKNKDVTTLWLLIYDSSTDAFWNGLCELLSELDSSRSQRLKLLGFPNDSVSIQEALNILGGIDLPKETVIVIDDYHLIGGAEVNRFVELLVTNEVENLHIVLNARYTEFQITEELKLKGYLHHVAKETL